MAEELQSLLERIRKDGVERADAEAEKIIAGAKTKAKTTITDAENEAKAIIEKAKAESALFHKRSESAVGQAARDIVLSVGEAVSEIFRAIIAAKVDEAFASDALPAFIKTAIEAYCTHEDASGLEVILNDGQKASVIAYFTKTFADALPEGVVIGGGRGIISGFRVAFAKSGIEHDFTGEALTRAIGKLLRPQLAEIVKQAVLKMEQKSGA